MDEVDISPQAGPLMRGDEENVCGMCGAPGERLVTVEPGMDPVCGRCADEYRHPKRYEPPRREECIDFDRFMDRTLIDERRRTLVDGEETNPQRLRAARYQDRPLNKVRVGGAR